MDKMMETNKKYILEAVYMGSGLFPTESGYFSSALVEKCKNVTVWATINYLLSMTMDGS
jgi:hypothetical protein